MFHHVNFWCFKSHSSDFLHSVGVKQVKEGNDSHIGENWPAVEWRKQSSCSTSSPERSALSAVVGSLCFENPRQRLAGLFKKNPFASKTQGLSVFEAIVQRKTVMASSISLALLGNYCPMLLWPERRGLQRFKEKWPATKSDQILYPHLAYTYSNK